MDKKTDTVSRSESNVSLKLADIQKRCAQLIDGTGSFDELTLEEPVAKADTNNPYNRG